MLKTNAFVLIFFPILFIVLLAIQDFKNRTIRVDTLLLFLASLLIYSFCFLDTQILLTNSIVNGIVLSVELLVLQAFARLRRNKNLLQMFGIGDILFLLTLIPVLSPIQFLCFLIGSASLALLGNYYMNHQQGIPFVTYCSFIFVFMYLYNIYKHYSV